MRAAFLTILVSLLDTGSVTARNIRLGSMVERQKLINVQVVAKRNNEESSKEEPSLIYGKNEANGDEETPSIPRRLGKKTMKPPQAIVTITPENGENEKKRGLKQWETQERPHNDREKDTKSKSAKCSKSAEPPKWAKPPTSTTLPKPTTPPKPTRPPVATTPPIVRTAPQKGKTTPPKPTRPPVATNPPIVRTASPKGKTTPPKPTRPPVATKPPIVRTAPPKGKVAYYRSTSGIFRVTLPLFSSATAPRYTGRIKLMSTLIEASKFKVNRIVEDYSPNAPQMPAGRPMEAMSKGDAMSAEGVNDFETNNQEANVDESDLLKTNGTYAFAGYGNYVPVWEVKTGRYVTTLTLPPIDNTDVQPDDPQPWPMKPLPVLVEKADEAPTDQADAEATVAPGKNRRGLSMMRWNPRPTVQSLILHGTKLVVIANGYGAMKRNELGYEPTFYDAFETNVRIYDISKLPETGEITFIKETHVHGSFNSARVVGNSMHLVTFANLNTYPFLEEPLWELQQQNLTKEEYLTAARKLAEEKLIPKFVESLIRDLSSHGELTDLAQISMWQSQLSPDPKVEENIFKQGIMTSYAQVTSLDLSADLSADSSKALPVTTAGVFMPSGWGHTYATEKMLMIAGQGWNWNVGMGGSVQTTYLHGFVLRDGRATPAAVGRLEGALLDQYAVDIVDGYMRVATTIRNNMWTMVRPMDGGDVVVQEQTVPRTENYIIVLTIPEIPVVADQFKSGLLEEVGRTKSLGKDGEVITGVRFADNVAYAVTFERTDPFYVITFDDPKTPVVRGELNITGFSSHLHFINKDSTLVLGVGQEADENGTVLGLQVTLYDAKNPQVPKVIDRHNVELEADVYSSSSAEWDYKALRYIPLSDDPLYGILIMPLRVDSYDYNSTEGNFDGFIVLDVSTEGISERFTIEHVSSKNFRLGCYYWAQLPERSFVVDGELTTLKGHSVRMHNLDTYNETGGIEIDENTPKDDDGGPCVYW